MKIQNQCLKTSIQMRNHCQNNPSNRKFSQYLSLEFLHQGKFPYSLPRKLGSYSIHMKSNLDLKCQRWHWCRANNLSWPMKLKFLFRLWQVVFAWNLKLLTMKCTLTIRHIGTFLLLLPQYISREMVATVHSKKWYLHYPTGSFWCCTCFFSL